METKTYFITLKPIDTFFFGGETTFNGGQKKNYFVQTEDFPQQTAILGMIRYQILANNNLLMSKKSTGSDEKCASLKVGAESYSPESSKLDFGKIVSISPVFLYNEDTKEVAFYAPYDQAVMPKNLCTYPDERYSLALEKSNIKVYSLQHQEQKDFYKLIKKHKKKHEDYTSKDKIFNGFISDNAQGKFLEYDDVFVKEERVGIVKKGGNREDKEEGFYRQVYNKMKNKALCFAFYVELKDGHGLRHGEVFLGAERSIFHLDLCEVGQSSCKKTFDTVLDQTFSQEAEAGIPNIKKIILISHTWVKDMKELKALLVAGVYKYSMHRFIQSNLTKTKNWVAMNRENHKIGNALSKSKPYYMLTPGSILYVHENKLGDLKILLNNPSFQKIGYNYFYSLQPEL